MKWIKYDYNDTAHPEPNETFLVYSEDEKNYFLAFIDYQTSEGPIWYEKKTLYAIPDVTYYMEILRIPSEMASFSSDEAMLKFIQQQGKYG